MSAALLATMLVSDAVNAAQYRADEPSVLAEDFLTVPFAAPVADSPPISSENAPREQRDPSRGPAPVVVAPMTPRHIFVPDADVNTTIEPRPATMEYNAFIGGVVSTFPVPDGPFTTVWWSEGPRPGEEGLAVILGHARTPRAAVFNGLPELQAGAAIALTGDTSAGDAVVARYTVERVVTGISKTDVTALRDILDSPPEGATLALITCSGVIDEQLSSRTDNTVVFASLDGMYSE